jgi:hypothetical protein
MSALLNVRDAIRDFLRRFDEIVTPVFRFVIAYIMLSFVNSMYGYEPLFDKQIVTLLLSIICALVSDRVVVLAVSVIMLLDVLAVSQELALLFFVAIVAMYCMYIRFFPDSAWIMLLVLILYKVNLIYAIPMIVMMFSGLTGIVPVAFGGIIYYMSVYLKDVNGILSQISDESSSDFQAYKYVFDSFKGNKDFILQIIVFAAAIVIGNIFYRLSIDYAWYIGLAVCTVVSMLFFVICGGMLGVDVEIGSVFIGSIVGFVVAMVIQVFKGVVDYSRKETVQFEDDEYYYYVKAIPKYNIDTRTKKAAPVGEAKNGTSYAPGQTGAGARRDVQGERRSQQGNNNAQRDRGASGTTRNLTSADRRY